MQCQDRNCGSVIGVAGEYLRLVRNMYLDIRTVYAVSRQEVTSTVCSADGKFNRSAVEKERREHKTE